MTIEKEASTLNLYPIDYPFETLVSRIKAEKPKLILNPDFQRKYKWDKEGWGRASKFIESCLMRIPLPSCYFAEDQEGRHEVIDGVQRLTTIQKFFDDEFPLEGMTTFKDLEGKKFSEIGAYRSELEATTIRCIVLRKENSKKLISEIFSRLNQGAVKLSDQEIRHAIYPGSLDKLLTELSTLPIIANFKLSAKSKSSNDEDSEKSKNSRESEEQVLRFFAFSEVADLHGYEGVLSIYLNDYMERKCQIEASETAILRTKFLAALDNCMNVFAGDVFRDATRGSKRDGFIYYDLLMTTVGLLDKSLVTKKAAAIKAAFNELCRSGEFRKTLSGGLQSKSSILKRRNLWQPLLQKAINE